MSNSNGKLDYTKLGMGVAMGLSLLANAGSGVFGVKEYNEGEECSELLVDKEIDEFQCRETYEEDLEAARNMCREQLGNFRQTHAEMLALQSSTWQALLLRILEDQVEP